MKRLVICCDGTWNRPDSEHVTNIEKIARTIETDLAATDGVQQLVLYLSGVGAGGYLLDRWLGGAFGFGLFTNVLAGYRFLALNYEPGDEIFVLGFSRGAYTARSLCGMVGAVGLLTPRALVAEKLPEAVARYRRADPAGGRAGQSAAEFKHDYCHPDTPIHFLGVFDTVGALGVPGAVSRRHQFHDVELGDAVRCARQALATDEVRMKFEPCLWTSRTGETEDPRVRQVWFEGVHSDVGGGYAETGLSDTALLWMAGEAATEGLVFDETLLLTYLASGSSAVRHESSSLFYRLVDLVIRLKIALHLASGAAFQGRRRRLDRPDCLTVRLAQPTADHFRAGEDYAPATLHTWWESSDDFAGCVEPALGLPEPSHEPVRQRISRPRAAVPRAREPGREPTRVVTPAAPPPGRPAPPRPR